MNLNEMRAEDRCLLVPMQLDALVQKKQKGAWKHLAQQLEALDPANFESNRNLGHFIEPSPADGSTDTSVLPVGIHLHWTIPAAFRRGQYDSASETGTLDFPLAPNRWLVVRIGAGAALSSWIVESDRSPDQGRLNYLRETGTAGGGHILPQKLGRVRPAEGWKEEATGPMFLTALAPGNPAFAASYMHSGWTAGYSDVVGGATMPSGCIFGFYDDMHAAAAGTFSYFVAGWFSDPARNPLGGTTTAADLRRTLDKLGWSYDGNALPDDFVCHAFVNNVAWTDGTPVSNVPGADAVQVSIGQNTTEALAALVRAGVRSGGADESSERMLAAYQYKVLLENGPEGEGFAALSRKLHEGGFLSVDGGSQWLVAPPEESRTPGQEDRNTEALALQPFPPSVSAALLQLNGLQARYDSLFDEWTVRQDELYAARYQWAYVQTDDWALTQEGMDAEALLARYAAQVETTSTRLRELNRSLESLSGPNGNVEGALLLLRTALQQAGTPWNSFEIKKTARPKFHEPLDPTLVIEGLKPDPRYFDAPAPRCRTASDLPEGFRAGDIDLFLQTALPACGAACGRITGSLRPAPLKALLLEALLLSGNTLPSFARLLAERGAPASAIETVRTAQGDPEAASVFIRSDAGPVKAPAGCTQWTQPWIPLYLEWMLGWRPEASGAGFDGWTFGTPGNAVDYGRDQRAGAPSGDQRFLSGRVLLSSDPARKTALFERKLAAAGTPVARNLLPMAQTLSGFHQQLARRRSGEALLPPMDEQNHTDHLDGLLQRFHWRPELSPSPFTPVRAGSIQLAVLRVVDAFGQALDLLTNTTRTALQLLPSAAYRWGMNGTTRGAQAQFLLPPRLIQPARLDLQWLSANGDERPTDSDPATSPVCGWLLHHPLTGSVQVFDAGGAEVAELRAGKPVPLPGRTDPEPSGIRNSDLEALWRFVKQEGALLTKQIEKLAEGLRTKASRDALRTVLPVGVPIAVLRARICLDRKGPAWSDPDGQAGPAPLPALPVCIGNSLSPQNGLLGYFPGGDFSRLRLPFGAGEAATLPPGGSLRVTLLADPRGSVQLACGFLPAARFELPRAAVEPALRAIRLRFLAAPLLQPAGQLKMPLLQERAARWEFISAQLPGKTGILTQTPEAAGPEQLKFGPLRLVEGWLRFIPDND